jgi:hypothetical protein
MPRKTKKIHPYRRRGKSLIAAKKINPQTWEITEDEAISALISHGEPVYKIKKIHPLKHQVCISFWDAKGNVYSGFFSYRIFERWQKEVEKLVFACQNLKEWLRLNSLLQYELEYYAYSKNVVYAIDWALKTRLSQLEAILTTSGWDDLLSKVALSAES